MSLLVGTPDNPVPDDCISGAIPARGEGHLRYARIAARTQVCRGTIVCLHGRNECVEKYIETMEDLADSGLDVFSFDWRGQGGSSRLLKDRARGYIDTFGQYVDDLDIFLERVVEPAARGAVHLLAHSTGALVALLAGPDLNGRVRRMALVAPLLRLGGSSLPHATTMRLAGFLDALGLGRMYLAGGPRPPEGKPFDGNLLTSDRRRYARNAAILDAAPELALGGPTVRWVREAGAAMDSVWNDDFMASVRIPLLMIAAGADRVVSTPAIEHFAARMRAASMVTVDGARHELLQEHDRYREQALAAVLAFLPGSPEPGQAADAKISSAAA